MAWKQLTERGTPDVERLISIAKKLEAIRDLEIEDAKDKLKKIADVMKIHVEMNKNLEMRNALAEQTTTPTITSKAPDSCRRHQWSRLRRGCSS